MPKVKLTLRKDFTMKCPLYFCSDRFPKAHQSDYKTIVEYFKDNATVKEITDDSFEYYLNYECLVGGTFKQSLLSYQYLINVFNDTYVLFWNARTHIFSKAWVM